MAHFGKIEAGNFGVDGNALSEDDFENPVEDETEAEHEADCSVAQSTNDLRHKLAGISVEQASYGTGNPVPGTAVVTRAVSEQAYRKHAPHPVRLRAPRWRRLGRRL